MVSGCGRPRVRDLHPGPGPAGCKVARVDLEVLHVEVRALGMCESESEASPDGPDHDLLRHPLPDVRRAEDRLATRGGCLLAWEDRKSTRLNSSHSQIS